MSDKGKAIGGALSDLKRIATPMTQAELDAVDEWGFTRKIRNRTDVIRELVRRGLAASAGEPS